MNTKPTCNCTGWQTNKGGIQWLGNQIEFNETHGFNFCPWCGFDIRPWRFMEEWEIPIPCDQFDPDGFGAWRDAGFKYEYTIREYRKNSKPGKRYRTKRPPVPKPEGWVG